MLNLFKLLFWPKNTSGDKCSPSPDIAIGILRNYAKRKEQLTQEEFDQACKSVADELAAMNGSIEHPGEDLYERMSKSLRRMDDELRKSSR